MTTTDTQPVTYDPVWLQVHRPQPMYDKAIHRAFLEIFASNPGDNADLRKEFLAEYRALLTTPSLNSLRGLEAFAHWDVCIGCTQFIDDLYQQSSNRIKWLRGEYLYHHRLNPENKPAELDDLESNDDLVLSLPFASTGDVHFEIKEILRIALEKNVRLHIDSAWMSCSRFIDFDFSHPAIQSVGFSLSKGFGLGGHRIGVRLCRKRPNSQISIMNDFNMIPQSLMHIGLHFMRKFGPDYFWNKYAKHYNKVCSDFNLSPTKSIHLAMGPDGPLGVRHLLRFLGDA